MPKGRVSISALLAFASLAISPPSSAEKSAGPSPAKEGRVGVAYSIDFIGIPFGHTTYDIRIAGDSYRTSSHFETGGVVSAFWQATIDAAANGQFTSAAIEPSEYDSHYARGDKHQRVKLTYGRDRLPTLLAEPPYNVHKYPVTDAQKKEGVDPLSAATSVLAGEHQSASSPCGTMAAVFDGRRRYNIEFTFLRDEPVKLENGLFNGKAHLCQLHYNQLGGFKPKILKEGRALPPAYALLGEIASSSAPHGHYLVPLRLWAWTGFGTVTATLSQLKVEDGASKS
jgi:hypothetical protein